MRPRNDAPDEGRRGSGSTGNESEDIFDDSVVYVTKQDSQVGADGGRISIYMEGEGELASFPMGQVDTINIFGNINFITPFVARANEHGCVRPLEHR